jgi:CheY-like chemotaxis protein
MSGGSQSLQILLVDDHEESLAVMARLLKMSGYSVRTATCVGDALARASEQSCDLLISDLGLPDRSGHELMREIRELFPVKGIALTGYTEDEDIRQSHEAGFERHLKKPVNFTELLAAIKDIGDSQAKP